VPIRRALGALAGAACWLLADPARADLTGGAAFRSLFAREIDLCSGACIGTGIAFAGFALLVVVSRATRRPTSGAPPSTADDPEDP
jgi:hypothetical protein